MKRFLMIVAIIAAFGAFSRQASGLEVPEGDGWLKLHLKALLTLNSQSNWIDTGLVVTPGWEMRVVAQGKVVLNTTLDGGAAGMMDADGVNGLSNDDPRKKKLSKTNKLFPVESLPAYALIGRIRNDRGEVVATFVLGKDKVLDIPAKGRLEMTINDSVKADNEGELKVHIFLRKKERIGF